MDNPARWMSMGALGFEVAASIGAGAWVGYQLDRWLASSPWCLLLGMIGGMVGAVWKTYSFVTLLSRADRRRSDRSEAPDER